MQDRQCQVTLGWVRTVRLFIRLHSVLHLPCDHSLGAARQSSVIRHDAPVRARWGEIHLRWKYLLLPSQGQHVRRAMLRSSLGHPGGGINSRAKGQGIG